MNMQIERATPADWMSVKTMLVDAGLPTTDLGGDDMNDFLLAHSASGLVGAIALQWAGQVGLLRSLVVAEMARGQGLGTRLVGALEARARALGVAELWLLTNDAGPFFAQHGYRLRPRCDVPATISASEEFRSLCPDTAELYSKTI